MAQFEEKRSIRETYSMVGGWDLGRAIKIKEGRRSPNVFGEEIEMQSSGGGG